MMSRRHRALTAVAVLAGGALSGCGSTQSRSGPAHVDLIGLNSASSFAVETADGFEWGVAQVPGVEQSVRSPTGPDPIKQVEMLDMVVGGSTAGIALAMIAPERFVESAAAAAREGVPLIAVDSPPVAGTDIDLYVGNDNIQLGRSLADLVIDQLPANVAGTVVLGNPRPGVPALDLRAAGIRAEFGKRLPRVHVLGPFDTGEQRSSQRTAWDRLALANRGALAFLGVGADGASLGRIRQATSATWLAGSFDVDIQALQAVSQGFLVLMSPEHYLKGAIAGRLLAAHAAGRMAMPHGWIEVPGLAVTKGNVDSFIRRQASPANRQAAFKAQLDSYFGTDGPAVQDLDLAR
jgi:ribose transport system substrate-binding protein